MRYVASGEHAALVSEVRAIAGVEEALERGVAEVMSVDQAYPAGSSGVVDASAQVDAYASATGAALAAGFTGFRAAVDVTSLVKQPEQREAFARYEHLLDQYLVHNRLSAVCAYDDEQLDGETITALASLHPATNQGLEALCFQLYASPGPDCGAELVGELDLAAGDAFARALDHADLQPVAGRLTLDVTGVEFINHRSMIMLAEYAGTREATLVLHTHGHMIRRLAQLLDHPDIRVEPPR